MTLAAKTDTGRPGGGFAILTFDPPSPVDRLAFEDRSSELFLSPDTAWSRQPHHFEVEPAGPGAVRIGPEIVNHIEADTIVAVHVLDGRVLGTLIWPALRLSAGAGDGNFVIAGPMSAGRLRNPPPPVAPPPVAPPPLPPPAESTLGPPPPPRAPPPRPVAPAALQESAHTRRGLAVALIALAALALAAAALHWSGAAVQQRLVCAGGGAMSPLTLIGLLEPCRASPREDQESAAYAAYALCVSGRAACEQDACADAYLRAAPQGAHADGVRRSRAEASNACAAQGERDADFTAFNACVNRTADACARKACVEQFRAKLTAQPYASALQAVQSTVEQACERADDESALAAFNACLARSAACDREACASALSERLRGGRHSAEIAAALQTARDLCAEEAAYADFNRCIARASACDRKTCGASLPARAWSGPHAREFSSALDSARDACEAETAYGDFSRCVARAEPCDRAACAASLPAKVRFGDRADDISTMLDRAQQDCAEQQRVLTPPTPVQPSPAPPVEPVPQPEANVRPSFDCSRASHAAEVAICADGDLAQLDLELAAAYGARRFSVSSLEARTLARSENDWVGYRNATCNFTSLAIAKACLIPIVRARIAWLRGE